MTFDLTTNEDGLIVRNLKIRSKDSAKREFTGIGVPFGEIYDMGYGYREAFAPGSIEGGESAKIFWQHREVIGRVISARDTADGYEVTAKISDTVQGRDAWTLLEDGAVDSLSIGFQPSQYRTEEDKDGTVTVTHTKVQAREFSLVNFPAYSKAKVTAHRHAQPSKGPQDMEPDVLTRADLDDLRSSQETQIEDLRREIEQNRRGSTGTENPALQWRSFAEFVKAVASGDESALNFHRDYTGGVLADAIVKDSWVGDYTRLVQDRRRIIPEFSQTPLPPTGNHVEYGFLKSDTTDVKKQEKEGDNLTGPGKITLGLDTSPVETFGGWAELSIQAIERATIPVLNTLLKALLLKYAKTTDAAVRQFYVDLISKKLADATTPNAFLPLKANATTDDWLDMIVDASMIFEERGYTVAGMHASVDQFKRLIRLKDGDNRLMTVQGTGINQVGTLNLSAVSGELANVQVKVIGGTATNVLSFYDPVAIETLESPGAPIQLQDNNIINLTKQFSIYGDLSMFSPFPDAILPVKVAATNG